MTAQMQTTRCLRRPGLACDRELTLLTKYIEDDSGPATGATRA